MNTYIPTLCDRNLKFFKILLFIRVIFHDTYNSSRYVGYVCIVGWYVKINWSGCERKRLYPNLRKAGNRKECQEGAQSDWAITQHVLKNSPPESRSRGSFSTYVFGFL